MRNLKYFLGVFFCIISIIGKTQNDVYDIVIQNKIKPLFDSLPGELDENSGFFISDNSFYLINDSGGQNCIYQIGRNGQIVKRIFIRNAMNVDWEEIILHQGTACIGDFGNNFGDRTNLCVYKTDFPPENLSEAVNVGRIDFSFEDYVVNSSHVFDSTDFDCEAMVMQNDSIYLFSKQWIGNSTVIYSLPVNGSEKVAIRRGEFPVGFHVTAAFFDYQYPGLFLLGYRNFNTYLFLSTGLIPQCGANTSYIRYELADLKGLQCEGIYLLNDTIFISSEQTRTAKQNIYTLSFKDLEMNK